MKAPRIHMAHQLHLAALFNDMKNKKLLKLVCATFSILITLSLSGCIIIPEQALPSDNSTTKTHCNGTPCQKTTHTKKPASFVTLF